MRRTRYQSRLTEKLEEDNKARTDVSRKSLPRKNEDTLVPEITFSEIMPDETIQEPASRLRRSSRVNATNMDLEIATPSRMARLSVTAADADHTVLSVREAAEKSKTKKSRGQATTEILSASRVDEQQEDEVHGTTDNAVAGRTPELSESHVSEEVTDRPADAPNEQDGSMEVHATECAPDGQMERALEEAASKTTSKKRISSEKPKDRSGRFTSRKQETLADDSAVNDENSPRNVPAESRSSEDTLRTTLKQRPEDEEEGEPKEIPARVLRGGRINANSSTLSETRRADREKTSSVGGDKETEEIASDGEQEMIAHDAASNICKVVLERMDSSHLESACGEETQPDPSPIERRTDEEVSLETLEIRKRIEKKCLRDSVSSDDEEPPRPGVTNAEVLFDTLIKPPENVVPTADVLDSSSFYQGTIPSRLFSPERKPVEEADSVEAGDGLTARFEAFKQFNSQKAPAIPPRLSRTHEATVPSFTLEEEATNDLDEVTNRAITLCMEEDSDADLDVVMKSKSRRSAAVGNSIVDPALCDIGTSMGLPSEQKDAESFVLMIDSTSRESSDSKEAQAEAVMQVNVVESVDRASDPIVCVSEDDLGVEELKNPRKSKLQSTFLPSPTSHNDVAVGTGPSLMATIRDAESIQDDRAGALVIDGTEGGGIGGFDLEHQDRDQSEKTVPRDVAALSMEVETAPAFENHCAHAERDDAEPDPETLDASIEAEAPPELLGILRGEGPLLSKPEEDGYETDEVLSDKPVRDEREGEEVNTQRDEDAAAREHVEIIEDVVEERQESQENEADAGIPEVVISAVGDGCENELAHSSHEVDEPRRRTHDADGDNVREDRNSSSLQLLPEQSLRRVNPLEGMDDVSLLDLIDDHWDALDLPQITLLSQTLSEDRSKTEKSREETPRLLLPKETPRSKSALSGDYRVGRDIKRGKTDTPLAQLKEIRKPRLSRRTLFDDAAEIPADILPQQTRTSGDCTTSFFGSSVEKRPRSYALDSTRLPNFDEAYVEMEFDARELKKRGEELFHSAVRSLLDENPEQKTHVQHALEELLTTQQEPIKRMMSLLVRKYALKEACEARKESYLGTQTRLARTRKYIVDTAMKLMPDDEHNAMKVFGFNPFEFKEPPPDSVRDINKRKAEEDEERLKKKSKSVP